MTDPADLPDTIKSPGLWRDNGWTARVVKNEDDEGWAVEMHRDGEAEPALVGPWTMGRDKVNPKPLDHPAFMALVKGASDVMRRHQQQNRARLHRSISFADPNDRRLRVDLDIAEDEDDPHAIVAVFAEMTGDLVHRDRVEAGWQLSAKNVLKLLGGR